tara:strand:- start:10174 stop:10635 length:462 start_codon:yes stop_codon:yes gene_type:complete
MRYVFDSDKLDNKKARKILATVLASQKRKDLVIAPSGAGKTTTVSRDVKFIKSETDVKKADSIVILSGAARSKDVLSKKLKEAIEAVNTSGGGVSYLYVNNMEILNRRNNRVSVGSDDKRSTKQLKGTFNAPLNQFDFVKALKDESKTFKIIK